MAPSHDPDRVAAPLVRLRTEDGGVTAAISARAASLRSLTVGGVPLVEPTEGAVEPPGMAGAVLAPWPNRVEGARWRFRGRELRLKVTEPGFGHALHGLLSATDFRIVDASTDATSLMTEIPPQEGYPFTVALLVEYRVRERGVQVSATFVNRGEEDAPVALGAHPYLRVADVPIEHVRVRIDADVRYRLDATHMPREAVAVLGSAGDHGRLQPIGEMPDHATYESRAPARPLTHVLVGPSGAGVQLRADPQLRWTQFYVAPSLDTDDGPRRAVAIEPMSAPPNALRTGTDLRVLPPGGTWKATWSIRSFTL